MGGESIVYDAIGNPTTYRGASLAFTGRRLRSYAKNGTLTSYRYDADGIRTQKTAGNTRHEYESEGGKIYREQIFEDNTLQSDLRYFYDAAGRPAMLQVISGSGGSSVYYYGTNTQGDVIAMYDADGNLCVSYLYDAWGNLLSAKTYTNAGATARSLNSLLYRGYYFDSESGFYYLQSRYYDPQVRRFINADSVMAGVGGSVQGYNLFAYCFNNSVNMSDSSGHWPQWIKDAASCVNNNIIQSVANFFSTSTNTIGGSFQDGIFRGSGSLTGGYSEFNGRLQVNSKDHKNNGMLGGYGKVSVSNVSGKIGIGNDDIALSLKVVGDVLTTTAQAGIQYKNGAGLAAKAKAAVLSGRATSELELFGWQIELGVSGDFLSVGAEAMIGVFPDEGFTAKASVGAGLFGGGFIFRIKPKQ